MKNITKKHFRSLILLWFFILLMTLIVSIIFLGTGQFIFSILWLILSVAITIFICLQYKKYLNFKHNTNVLIGIITNVGGYRAYHITIKTEDKNYLAIYIFISSRIKDKVGSKCIFVVDKKGKAYIKDIE